MSYPELDCGGSGDPCTWGETVALFWECVPSPEREASIAMADTHIAASPFQVKELVRIAFFLGGVDATEKRWEVWQANWGVHTVVVEVDEVEVEVLLVDQGWMYTLATGFEDGSIMRRPTHRCKQLTFAIP